MWNERETFFYSEVQVLSRYMLSVMHRYLFNNNRYTCWCVFVTLVIQFNTSYNKILISNVIFTMQLNLQLLLLSFFEFIFASVCVCVYQLKANIQTDAAQRQHIVAIFLQSVFFTLN